MLERFPWVALALPAIAIGLGVYWLYRARKGGRTELTLTSLIDGITKGEVKPEETAEEFVVKNANGATGPIVKAEVLKRTAK